jgi:hypothetical protein
MASRATSSNAAAAGRRRHSRLRVHLPARLITLDGTFHATLLNLSFSGAKIKTGAANTRPGASAVLTWGTFEAFCTISWCDAGHCGLDFDEPLKPDALLATRDIADITPWVDSNRVAVRDWVVGRVNRL